MLKKIFGYRPRKKDTDSFSEFVANKVAFDQFREYIGFHTNLPSLHIVKQNNVHKYRQKYDFKIFIETGTYLGDMVEAQRSNFNQIYSIELGESLYQKSTERFKDFPHVKILLGDSSILLEDLLTKTIEQPALFWLDGHYSSGVTAKGEKDTPIMEELAAILQSPIHHGILIDDARLFTGEADYPSIDELSSFIKAKDPKRKVTVADDIICVFRD
ncbi:hypothetical protein GCM10007415_05560 [Parapedobacter pyrenivorans]|uniref:Uncharacterized protein n=1 Tax=Parapedobacter pyrenivorans TaxID=1305674 RepID=A0A917M3C6_9SPHI|nr:hypothetical protein [Parapedobacter pyrenivorans]GGG76621.1 hypothetical protein GCM10007415_05560 [Parapedobacter pyrenivorans]